MDINTTSLWSDTPKTFLEHLEELRRSILWGLLAVILGIIIAFPLTPSLLRCLRQPLASVTEHPDAFLRSLEITGGFTIALRLACWTGLLLATPILAWLAIRFIFPALRALERRVFLGALVAAAALFFIGVTAGFFMILPTALKLMFGLHEWLGIRVEWTITSYIAFTVQLLLGFGLAFELPVLLLALGWLGILSSAMLRQYRRHSIVAIFILAMFLTPPDVFSQVLMAIPMMLLYEICIWLIRYRETRKGMLNSAS